jgi:general secretion pathway protein D
MTTKTLNVKTAILLFALGLSGCSTYVPTTQGNAQNANPIIADNSAQTDSVALQPVVIKQNSKSQSQVTRSPQGSATSPISSTIITQGPLVPTMIGGNLRPLASTAKTSTETKGNLTVSFEQLGLPAFIHAVYGGILKLNYALDPAVSARTELVTFRTPQPLSAERLQEVSAQLLKSYGIAVQDLEGLLRIVPQANLSSTLPLIRRGRAQPTVPLPLRPIFHYIETEAVRPTNFLPTLKSMLSTRVNIDPDSFGGLLISGQPEDVQIALELVQVFDQPSMRGQNNARIVPRYWGADEFARRLAEVLRAEGYSVGTQSGTGEPLVVLSLPTINSLLIFASSKSILDHAIAWSKELDQPSTMLTGASLFTYAVQHADAQELAKSLNELINGISAVQSTPGAAPALAAPGQTATRSSKRVVVNNATNNLIFQGGSQDEYRQWLALVAELDKPVKSALLDVLVAEVALTDSRDLGFAWQLDQLGSGAAQINFANTAFATSISGNGIALNGLLGGNTMHQLAISALAAKSNSRVISNPKLLTRNGETASINVGQDVPTISSQATTTTTGIATTTIPQTIQYRNTGVILRVRPVVHAGDRIDLDISQEVSSAESTVTGVSTSPTIRRRAIETKLSLRDGATVMLGGMISETNSDSESGVPFLKDIPILGNLFKKSGTSRTRTELVVLITPYIINDSAGAEAATNTQLSQLGSWADSVRDRVTASRKALTDRTAAAAAQSNSPEQGPVPTSTPITSSASQPSPATQEAFSAPPAQATVLPSTITQGSLSNGEGRMLNLIDLNNAPQAATAPNRDSIGNQQPTQPYNEGQQMDGPQSSSSPAARSGKDAPSNIKGVNLPKGSTIVEDPQLLKEILKANGR